MGLPAIHKKLLREIRRLRGQIVTIALVVASGITSFVALGGTYASLESARDRYYDQYRFANVFASAEHVPEWKRERLLAIPGVKNVETRIAKEVAIPIEGMRGLAYGRLLSVPRGGAEPTINALHLRVGRMPERGRENEVVALESFANAHGLRPGHRVPVVINGKLEQLRIVGLATSPEFVFAVRPGALVSDPKRYAVLWMDRSVLASAYGLESAFNDVSLTLEPGTSERAVTEAVDRILAPHGGVGATPRADQLSNKVLNQELAQLSMLASMVPLVFLGVTAFLINLVLGRWIRLQRPEIATLKALGYADREIAVHYLGLAAVVLIPGSLLGVIAGYYLGSLVLGLYSANFAFPDLHFVLSPTLLGKAVVVSSIAAVGGALGAVRSAVRLSPAEAMRPPAPARYRRGPLEKIGLDKLVGPLGTIVLREVQRRPFRTALSSLGIAGAVSLLILGRFGWDSFSSYFDYTFRREQRQDLQVLFERPMPPRVEAQLARMPGVLVAEGLRVVPARVRHEQRRRDVALMGLPEDSDLRRIVVRDGSIVRLPEDSVLISQALAELLEVSVGDRLELELREGERRAVTPLITGLVDEVVGLQVYAKRSTVDALSGDGGALSSVLLSVDPSRVTGIERRIRESPDVLDVADVHADMERLFDMNAQIMDVWTFVAIALSASVVFGVVYNNARVALAARSRELASLRVLGFSKKEISVILLGGLAVEVLIALPVGLLLGRGWAEQFMTSMDKETFRWSVVIAPSTYVLAILVTLAAASISALWVRRNLDHLDLIEVLKARE